MAKVFPTLYKLQGKRARVWIIKVEENDEAQGVTTVTHGLEDGALQEKVRIKKRGKGKNTAFQQALADAESLWKDQIENGGYKEDKNSIHEVEMAPMLAYDFKKKKHAVKYPANAQPKLDGARCLAFKDPETGEIVMITRERNLIISLPHIKASLEASGFFDRFPTWYTDGEIYKMGMPLQKIIGIVNTDVNIQDLDQKEVNSLKYYIFDCFDIDNPDMPFEERFSILQKTFTTKVLKKCPDIALVETTVVKNEKEVETLSKQYYDQGYEGVMIRNMDGPYTFAKGRSGRSSDLLKHKPFKVDEFLIVDVEEAENKPGTPILVCQTIDHKKFRVNASGSLKYQKFVYKHRNEFIGWKVRLRYNDKTSDGIPKFCQWDLDKDNGQLVLRPA